MVKDKFDLELQNSSLGDKLSDKFLGTNNVANKNMINNYNLQKAINLNKYSWNVEGMRASGINPLANSSQLGNVSSSQSTSDQSGDPGFFVNEVLDTMKQLSPSTQIKETRKLVHDILSKK